MTGNIIMFPGARAPRPASETSDLHEALWMAAFLLREREELVFDVAMGKTFLVDEAGRSLPNVFGEEPAICFAGTRHDISTIVEMGQTIEGSTPLPAHMLVYFAIWNVEDSDNPVLTYADAIEMMEGSLCNIQWEKEEFFEKRRGPGGEAR